MNHAPFPERVAVSFNVSRNAFLGLPSIYVEVVRMASEALRRILSDLTRVEGVRGALVVSRDGYVIEAVIPRRDINAEDIGAAVSSLVNSATRLGRDFGLGEKDIMTLEYSNGMIVVGTLGENFVMVIADKSALIGMIRNEIKKQRERLKAVV